MIFICTSLFASGQYENFGGIYGLNIATWSGDVDKHAEEFGDGMNEIDGFDNFHFSNTPRISVNVGITRYFKINEFFSIQPEILFSMKGTKLSGSGDVTITENWETYTYNVEEDLIYTTNYLELPILAKFSIGDIDNKVKPYFIAGPYVSYIISSKIKVKVKADGEKDKYKQKNDVYKNFDAGFDIGGGLEFSDGFRIELRYQIGLIPVIEEMYDDGYKMLNRLFSINIFIPTDQ